MLMKELSSANEKLVGGSRFGTVLERWHNIDRASIESPTAAERLFLDLRQRLNSLLGQ